jgi:septum site-determining protein MinD
MGRSIGILSLKGGVGKTSVVSALGDALSSFGKQVLLIDGNVSAPNLGLHLNIIDPEVTLHNVLMGQANASKAIYKLDNFDVIPASIVGRSVNPLKLRNKIRRLKNNYDLVLLDSPPSLNEETLGVVFASDALLFVTTPDYPTLRMSMKAITVAKQNGVPIIGMVLNKVHQKDFETDIDDIEDMTGVPVMARIPHDIDVLKALSKFIPSTVYKPKSDASIEYKKLAATLIGEKYKAPRFKDFFRRTPLRQDINREIYYERIFK